MQKRYAINFSPEPEFIRIVERECRRIEKADPRHSPCASKAFRNLLRLGGKVRAEEDRVAREQRIASRAERAAKKAKPTTTEQSVEPTAAVAMEA